MWTSIGCLRVLTWLPILTLVPCIRSITLNCSTKTWWFIRRKKIIFCFCRCCVTFSYQLSASRWKTISFIQGHLASCYRDCLHILFWTCAHWRPLSWIRRNLLIKGGTKCWVKTILHLHMICFFILTTKLFNWFNWLNRFPKITIVNFLLRIHNFI